LQQSGVLILYCSREVLREVGLMWRSLSATMTCPDTASDHNSREGENQKNNDRDREEDLHALEQNTKAQSFLHSFDELAENPEV